MDSVFLGNSSGGASLGRLALTNTSLDAQNVIAGAGIGGRAEMILFGSSSIISDDLALITGLLDIDRSLIEVGDLFTFGANARMHVGIDGLARGGQYGAIDAARAVLSGQLEVDFLELVFNGDSAVFDVLRSGSADGIAGDFDAFSLLNLPAGYSASAGLEVDGVEVYRIRLQRNDVPEPGSWLLAALGLGLAAHVRRRRRQMISK